MSGSTPARQSELTALSQEAYQLPTWDRTRENQMYVRQQKAAEEQLRFDKTEKPSCLASKDNGGSVPQCPPRMCNLVGILLLDKTANVSIATSSSATNNKRFLGSRLLMRRQSLLVL